jgi:DNA-binding response OmpR family regulator
MIAHPTPPTEPTRGPARLIVVDDEPELRGLVADYLARDGHRVNACAGGAELDRALCSGPADLLILDVAMPGEDGLSIARRLRATRPMPILMLTALDDVVDRVVGLEVGADDYLTKPFDLRELRARVRAMLRRAAPPAPAAAEPEPPPAPTLRRVPFGRVQLDLDGRCLRDPCDREIRLTATEFELLEAFASNPNRILSRDRLYDLAAGRERDPLDRTVDIRVTRLRKKVETDAAKPTVIRTVRGAGYMYVPARAG